jgi:hypothetical protein
VAKTLSNSPNDDRTIATIENILTVLFSNIMSVFGVINFVSLEIEHRLELCKLRVIAFRRASDVYFSC